MPRRLTNLSLLTWHLSRRWERRPSLPTLLARRRTLVHLGALTLGTLAASCSHPATVRRCGWQRPTGAGSSGSSG